MMSRFRFIFHLLKEFSLCFSKNRCLGEFFRDAELPCSVMLMQLDFTLTKHCNKAELARASQSVILGETVELLRPLLSSRHQSKR